MRDAVATAGNPVPPAEVRSMFDRIAPIYDVMNTAMTLGVDARWRRAAVRAARLTPGDHVVDVACGTGALTRELASAVGRTGRAVGIDASAPMIERAARRPTPDASAIPKYVRGDALDLPLDDAVVDAATIAFGLRNVTDYARCLAEMVRVTRPGGRVVVLELASPEGGLGRLLAATWFRRIVPLVGRIAGGGSAYRYLPDSVRAYPPPAAMAAVMVEVGLRDVRWRRLWPGLVTVHVGRRA